MGLWKAENSGGSNMDKSDYSVYTVEDESQSRGGAWKEITLSQATGSVPAFLQPAHLLLSTAPNNAIKL